MIVPCRKDEHKLILFYAGNVSMRKGWESVEVVVVVANINCGCFLSANKSPRKHLLNIL